MSQPSPSNVRSAPAPASSRKESAVFTRAQLARQRGKVERIIAWMVLLVSFSGTVIAFHGGWEYILALQISLGAVAAGLFVQIVLTWLQWAYHDRRAICWASRSVDAALTALGLGPLLAPGLVALLVAVGASNEPVHALPLVGTVSAAYLGAWAFIALLSLGAAWYPESRLID